MKTKIIQSEPKRSFFASIFISPDEPRLRAGWRLILQTIMMAVFFIGIILSPYRLLEPPTGSNFDLVV